MHINKPSIGVKVFLLALILVITVSIAVVLAKGRSVQNSSPLNQTVPDVSRIAQGDAVRVKSTKEDPNLDKVRVAIERMAGLGNSQLSLVKHRLCILVDQSDRYFELDMDVLPEEFPQLQQLRYQAPSPSVSRTMSRYRATVKQAFANTSPGDTRIIIIFGPRHEWNQIIEARN